MAFAYLSKTSSFRFPGKGTLPEAPSTEPLEREIPHPQSPFIQLSKSPVDEPSSSFPKSGASMKRNTRLQILLKVQGTEKCGHLSRRHHHHHELWRVWCGACSLNLKVKLVLPSFPRTPYISLPFLLILQCLFGYPLFVSSLSEL